MATDDTDDSHANWGPWMGVPPDRLNLCAVVGCTDKGKRQTCMYDGRHHHHGCIHYDCPVAIETKHGLPFRRGWGLLCDTHYAVLSIAWDYYNLHKGEKR